MIERGDNNPNIRHQLHLLAVACLESSIELGTDIRLQVQARLSNLVPPRNITDAKSLASAGELAIPFLAYKSIFRASEAAACVRALALIGGDAALDTIKGYTKDPSQAVKKELFRAGNSFDPENFGKDVVDLIIQNNTSAYLNLRGARLTSLPPAIFQITSLCSLVLWDNRLTSLPPEIGELSQLEYLDLDGNQLTSLPPEIGNLRQLKVLYLSWNQLTSLPPEIGKLSQLKSLYLNVSQLTSLPPEIGKLSQLELLVLHGNQLTSLPPEIGNLRQLQYLHLDRNQLTSLPPDIGNLSNLRQLYLRRNLLTSLPPEIVALTNLNIYGQEAISKID